MNSAPIRFGRFALDIAQRRLLADGVPVTLGSRAFEVLRVLVQSQPRVIGKAELLDLVWPGLVVEENNVEAQISALRKVLGPAAIATVPGRGYQFTVATDDALPASPSTALPAVATGDARGNLPLAVRSLVGRDADLDRLAGHIAANRLVTLVGPAGVGKTTLALASAHAARERWRDGVWIVELAALADGAAVARSVMETLRVAVGDRERAVESLVDILEGRRLLLVLDNCEHLLDAVAPVVAAIGARALGVHVLATSQQRLNVPGEVVMLLDPLTVPETAAAPEDAARHGALRLFEERAQAADARFALTADNVGTVADICRRLDGLPLAIELAAARVRALGVRGLHERLDARFRVLTAGARTALPRHRTLHAALDWSHELLSPREQVIFRRLAVFSGGFTLDLAQRVVADDALDAWAVLDGLGSLVDRSMVVASVDDPPRYALLETMRAYARERLDQAAEATTVARRHAQALRDLFVDAIEQRLGDGGGLGGDAYLARTGAELENARAALAFAAGPDGDDALAVALAAAVAEALDPTGHGAECVAMLQGLRTRVVRLDDLRIATAYWVALAWVAGDRLAAGDDYAHIVAQAEQGCRTLALRRPLFRTLIARAWRSMRHADYASARTALDEAATLERADWPAWLLSDRLNAEGAMHVNAGDVAGAQRIFTACRELLPSSGEEDRRVRAAINLGLCAGMLERWEESAALLQQVLETAWRTHQHTSGTIWAAGQLLVALTRLGRLDEAHRLLVDHLPLWRADGVFHLRLFAVIHLAVAQGRAADAMRLTGAQDRMDGGATAREPMETRIRNDNRGRLEALLPAVDERERLRREGAALDEAAIVALCIARPAGPAANA